MVRINQDGSITVGIIQDEVEPVEQTGSAESEPKEVKEETKSVKPKKSKAK